MMKIHEEKKSCLRDAEEPYRLAKKTNQIYLSYHSRSLLLAHHQYNSHP